MFLFLLFFSTGKTRYTSQPRGFLSIYVNRKERFGGSELWECKILHSYNSNYNSLFLSDNKESQVNKKKHVVCRVLDSKEGISFGHIYCFKFKIITILVKEEVNLFGIIVGPDY